MRRNMWAWAMRSLTTFLAVAVVGAGLAAPASATDDIPYGPQDPVKGMWFTTPGGIRYYSPGIGGHVETGRITVSVPPQGLAPEKGVRIVLTDATYGVQEVRLWPEGDGPTPVPFCGVPPMYRNVPSWEAVPPGYQKQELIAYFPEADGSEYALRYDVNWWVGGFSLSSMNAFRNHALRSGKLKIKATKKKRQSAWRVLRVLKRERRVARRDGDFGKVRAKTRRIVKRERQIRRLARVMKKLEAQQRTIAPLYEPCPGGPYTAP